MQPENLVTIVECSLCLHNYINTLRDTPNATTEPAYSISNVSFQDIGRTSSNAASRNPEIEILAKYFLASEGSAIMRCKVPSKAATLLYSLLSYKSILC